ncbi:UvrD-helicase domain-containing protein [Parapedobacter koreensis]|uniref:DNA 3'-5' helicase n=1 Tax=Parapedobacter koreensis TaxID=332977 RepID=A0A1H7SP06_9SPHI|nr:UvrD-helicase domain-containing protein [Parapedobacter koreensis]SEL74381.1 ATP-dependent exoDNAse (exonuclease V) beta subunit (contains helicase and exonuclease domains) [Parapedobacter koreensis]
MMPTVPPLKILKASAGSGKTFSLTAHYLTLLFSGENKYREILAITFTNKATAEMKGRILEVLVALATGDGQQEDHASGYREILLGAYPQWDTFFLQQRAAEVYRKILHDYSRFSVSTIDGFTQKVIRGFTFELGIDAGYKLEMNIRKVKADLVLRLNRLLDERPDLLQWIMDYAQTRIDRDENWNYRWALSDLASEIFKEDFQDFDKAVSDIPEQELFASLDSYCKETVKQFEEAFEQQLKTAADTFAASGVDVMDLAGKSRSQLGKLPSLSAQNPYDTIKKLEKYIHMPDEWQKGRLSGQMAVLYHDLNPLLEHLYTLYTERSGAYYLAKAIDENLYYLRLLKEMSTLLAEWRRDNAAQLISDAQILLNNIGTNESGDPTFIWEKTGNRFRHFLFDEFQDTSRKQWDNLRPLLINAMGNASGKRSEHLIVGDVKQSIYRWRNGDWRILLDRAEQQIGTAFNTAYTSSLIESETLEVNYRSHENIVAFNNAIFDHAPKWLQQRLNDHILNELGEEQYERWWKTSGNHDTIVRAYQDSRQRLPPTTQKKGGTVQVDFIDVESNNHRASAVKEEALIRFADTLLEWVSSGTYRPGQISILVRTNNEAREVIQYLLDRQRESSVTFDVISGDALALTNHPAIRLLIDTLRALVGKLPDAVLYMANCVHLYNQLLRRETVSPDEWVRLSACKPAELTGLLPEPLCSNWEMWAQLPLAELIESLIVAYRLQTNDESIPYLLAFRDLVAAFTANGERGIPAFLAYWEEEGIDRALPATGQADAVEVLTIHKSKGLAFDVVMIPFCSWPIDGRTNGNFWVSTEDTPYALLRKTPVKYKSDLGKSRLYQAYFEEMLFNYMDALNTLYVATTRTRKHLYITAPGKKGTGEINALLAGDLLLEVLPGIEDELHTVFHGGIQLGDTPELIHTEHKPGRTGWSFSHYPASARMKEELARPEIQAELDIVRLDAAKRHGQLLHELMADTASAMELESRLDALQAQGLLREEERADVLTLAQNTWSHPQLAQWLNGDYAHWNERSIILPGGKTLRPDKVLVRPDETIVLDFKFTQHEDEAHLKQVVNYQLLLREMGMPNVKGYVYYGALEKLVEV